MTTFELQYQSEMATLSMLESLYDREAALVQKLVKAVKEGFYAYGEMIASSTYFGRTA